MFATEPYSVVEPALAELRSAITTWHSTFVAPPLGEAEARPLGEELEAAARQLDVPYRQARLLAQAALLPTADLLDATGLTAKGKRRAKGPSGAPQVAD
jgi:hypothetical protein